MQMYSVFRVDLQFKKTVVRFNEIVKPCEDIKKIKFCLSELRSCQREGEQMFSFQTQLICKKVSSFG